MPSRIPSLVTDAPLRLPWGGTWRGRWEHHQHQPRCTVAPAGRASSGWGLGRGSARRIDPPSNCRALEAPLGWLLAGVEGDRYETPAWRTWQLRGGGFPAPYSSPLVPPLTDGQQRVTLFSCQSAFPATLSRSVTDEPRNSKNALGVARRFPDVHRLSPKRPGITLGTKPLHVPPEAPLRRVWGTFHRCARDRA